jgi:hypothetical protein
MARTKQIVNGFNNSQKFRFLVRQPDVANAIDFGMTITIQQMADQFATTTPRVAVWQALEKLALDRFLSQKSGRPLETGLVTRTRVYDHKMQSVELEVQVDLF